jgi:hypothetical protein
VEIHQRADPTGTQQAAQEPLGDSVAQRPPSQENWARWVELLAAGGTAFVEGQRWPLVSALQAESVRQGTMLQHDPAARTLPPEYGHVHEDRLRLTLAGLSAAGCAETVVLDYLRLIRWVVERGAHPEQRSFGRDDVAEQLGVEERRAETLWRMLDMDPELFHRHAEGVRVTAAVSRYAALPTTEGRLPLDVYVGLRATLHDEAAKRPLEVEGKREEPWWRRRLVEILVASFLCPLAIWGVTQTGCDAGDGDRQPATVTVVRTVTAPAPAARTR